MVRCVVINVDVLVEVVARRDVGRCAVVKMLWLNGGCRWFRQHVVV